MLEQGSGRFELYDIFSVFVPGLTLLIVLVPFLPQTVDPSSLEVIVPLLVLGFVVGRALHTIAVDFERKLGRPSHRDRFASELANPESLSQATIAEFLYECESAFESVDQRAIRKISNDTGMSAESLYVNVRSRIHMDSRGRSRTFQAIYSFHRSMWLVTLLAAAAYLVYGLADGSGYTTDAVSFTTHIGGMGFSPGLLITASYLTLLVGAKAFSDARGEYQKYFIQYLIADFLTICDPN